MFKHVQKRANDHSFRGHSRVYCKQKRLSRPSWLTPEIFCGEQIGTASPLTTFGPTIGAYTRSKKPVSLACKQCTLYKLEDHIQTVTDLKACFQDRIRALGS